MKKILKWYNALSQQTRAAGWFVVCAFLQKGISEITTPIFSRILTTAEYGKYSVFNTWLNIITVFVVMKLYAGVYTQGLVKNEDRRDEYVSSMYGLATTLCIGWTIIYLVGRDFWNGLFKLTTVQMLAMLVMIWSTACFSLWATKKRVQLEYKSLLIVTIIISLLKPIVGVIFVVLAEDKVTARILGLALVEFAGYSWLSIAEIKKGRRFFDKGYWKSAILLCAPLIPHYLCQTALNSADRIMIESMVGDSEAGIYSLAYSVSQIMTLVSTALVQTVSPWIGKKIKDKKTEEIPNMVYKTMILVGAANILVILFAPELIFVFGPKSYHDAIWVMPPVALSVFFSYSYSMFAAFELYFDKTKLMSVATMAGAVLNIILNYYFIKAFGYYAAGYTTLICFILYVVFHYILMNRIIKKNISSSGLFDTKKIVLISFLLIVFGLSIMVTYKFSFVRYGLILLLTVILVVFRKKVMKIVGNVLEIKR